MHSLSEIYKKLGKLDKAEILLIQLLTVSRETHGDKDIQTLVTVSAVVSEKVALVAR